MTKRPPHILVTTPESLYLLLTSEGGRAMLQSTRTVIVDEIHALVRDKRGSHLALSLERLEALVGRPVQRIGLSATQKPLEEVGAFLVGAGRECALVDCRHVPRARPRDRGAAVAAGDRLLARAVGRDLRADGRAGARAPHDARLRQHAQDGRAHRGAAREAAGRGRGHEPPRQPLARAAARRRAAAQGGHAARAGRDRVARARHRHRRRRPRRPGRRHALDRHVPAARRPLGPRARAHAEGPHLPADDRRAGRGGGAAPLRARRAARPHAAPPRPLDILAQQIVAECVAEPVGRGRAVRALPARVAVPRPRARGVRRGRAPARGQRPPRAPPSRRRQPAPARDEARAPDGAQSGGAIPDTADYQVLLEPEGTLVGTVNEDWAIESNGGDIFQLGNTSWRILRVEPGVVRVADAKGQPPRCRSGSARRPGARASCRPRSRTSARRARSPPTGGGRRHARPRGRRRVPARGLRPRLRRAGRAADRRVRARRPAGPRVRADAAARRARALLRRDRRHAARRARAVRLAHQPRVGPRAAQAVLRRLRLRAAGGRQRGGDRAVAWGRSTASRSRRSSTTSIRRPRGTCSIQALLAAPMFGTRWRWNAQRSLLLERARNGKRVPAALLRMRADDLLAAAFPAALACPETLPGGPLEVPDDHPIVRQTIEDCLTEAMDVDGFLEVVARPGRRHDRAARHRHARALRLRARHPLQPAVHVPRRRAARGAPHPGRDDAAHPGRPHGRRARRARCRRGRARARRGLAAIPRARGGARGAALDGLRRGRGGRALAAVARRAARGRPRRARRRPLVRGRGHARSQGGAARPAGSAGAGVRRGGLGRRGAAAAARVRGLRPARAPRRAGRPGATGACSRASSATRSTGCAARSSP